MTYKSEELRHFKCKSRWCSRPHYQHFHRFLIQPSLSSRTWAECCGRFSWVFLDPTACRSCLLAHSLHSWGSADRTSALFSRGFLKSCLRILAPTAAVAIRSVWLQRPDIVICCLGTAILQNVSMGLGNLGCGLTRLSESFIQGSTHIYQVINGPVSHPLLLKHLCPRNPSRTVHAHLLQAPLLPKISQREKEHFY